jgi:hypothetical protein
MRYNLLSQKASGGNQIMNAGLQNIFGGMGNASSMMMANQMYGGGGGSKTIFQQPNRP